MNPERNEEFEHLRLPDVALWTPGPHALTPAVGRVLGTYRATYSHRSTDFKTVYARAVTLLREAFRIPEGFTPLIFGHSGSYNWEMIAVNTPSCYRALGLDMGAFSARWACVFERLGRSIDLLRVPWGHGVEPDTWRAALQSGYDIALLTHNETATGVALPVGALCEDARLQAPETLVAIDGVSIAGAVELVVDFRS